MRRNLLRAIAVTAAAAALAAAAPPATLHAQQSDSARAERDRQKDATKDVAKQAAKDAARERADREREARDEARDRARDRQQAARDRAREAARHGSDDGDDEGDADRAPATRIDTTIALGANGVVDLSLVSGDITVTGWSRSEAKVRAWSDHGDIRLDHTAGRLALDVRSRYGRAGETHFEVTVPEGTRVLMRSTSGDLRAHGVKGELEARSTSGDVDVTDVVRSATIETVSGDVTAARIAGDVHGSSVSGDVSLDGVTGDVEYGSVSGDLSLTGARGRSVHLSAVSGDLTYAGALDPAGRYEFGTHSGEVELRLPDDASAAVSAQTFSGEIESDFALTMKPAADGARRSGRRMEFTLGHGGPRVTAETFSGNITLVRGTGGRGSK